MKTTLGLASALLAITLLAGCNKHNVPLGGACTKGEDCAATTLACYLPPGQDQGYCSQPCVVAPPAGVQPGGPGCESGGLVCKKAAAAHPVLGAEFCVKP
ncbi:MAG TPA: hypothetical protein VGK67_05355 [Myxococcales bacterium]|jgi:hypothetical protein